jgi:hypothetical protein
MGALLHQLVFYYMPYIKSKANLND